MSIGNQISELRKERGMTQESLADLLFVSRDLVAKWETGKRRPDYETVEKIASVFEVPPDIILQKNRYVFEELSTCIPAGTKLTEDELTLILNSFLNGLSRNETKFFVRRYYSLLSVADIASETGIKENHVRSRLAKIRKKLTKFIKEWK